MRTVLANHKGRSSLHAFGALGLLISIADGAHRLVKLQLLQKAPDIIPFIKKHPHDSCIIPPSKSSR